MKYDKQGEYVPGPRDLADWLAWRLYRLWAWPFSKIGHWEHEHAYKECPSGERYCTHGHYKLGGGMRL